MSGMAHFGSDGILDGVIGLHQILPSQYYDTSGGHRLTGEQRLMLALLADAINVYQQGVLSRSTRKRMLYVDSERWIMAERSNRHAFTFETVCDSLGINPAVLRRRMITWKHETRREPELPCSTHHLRLKITPRAKSMSHRRRRSRSSLVAV
ncbi:MAG TPA: hypothetical protein VJX23_03720 [Candidatus Binataceae bacterium]|nr:hypothetical protein [Candidatus Binataceae bacterium]